MNCSHRGTLHHTKNGLVRFPYQAVSVSAFCLLRLAGNSFPAWSFVTDKGVQRCYATHETNREPNLVIVRFAPGLRGNLD